MAVVLVPIAAVGFSVRQLSVYSASAQVLLSQQDPTAIGGTGSGQGGSSQVDRNAQTQADLARIPIVAVRALKLAGQSQHTPGWLLSHSSVVPSKVSNLLGFNVQQHVAKVAVALANAYAKAYIANRKVLDTSALENAAARIQTQINTLVAKGDRTSALYQSLLDRENSLRTAIALQTSNARLIKPATHGTKIQPKPVRSGLIGLGLGLFLGFGLALLWEALDTRVRTAEGVAERLGLPLLGRIPEPSRRLRAENRLVMLDEPSGAHAEAFRVLRTNLEFANLERGARTILITSAVSGEGKSTTAANLAVALAYAGRHVILVNLDLRRPHRSEAFQGNGVGGLTDVALGRLDLGDALQRLELPDSSSNGSSRSAGLMSLEQGVLETLDTGPLPPSPGDFLLTSALAEILERLAERADVVLIDSPPLLSLGDTLILSSKVDAILLVTRINVVRRPMLNELRRVLHGCPAAKLGFVVTGAQSEEGYYYDYARRYDYGATYSRHGEEVR